MDKKDKIIKKYYFMLGIFMVLYLVIISVLNSTGVYDFRGNKLLFIGLTFLYYLVVKNTLANYYKKKIFDLDPELKEKAEEKTEKRKQLFSFEGKWYKDTTFIYALGIIILLILVSLFTN